MKPGRTGALDLAGSEQFRAAPVDLAGNDAFLSAITAGRQSASEEQRRGPSIAINRGTAAEQVMASELNGRDESSDALSMMVSSMVHMVQAGKTKTDSRWSA